MILNRWNFGLKCSKNFIPDNQKHPHIFIKVGRVTAMMHPVMGWRDHKDFEKTHFLNQFSMYKKFPKFVLLKK